MDSSCEGYSRRIHRLFTCHDSPVHCRSRVLYCIPCSPFLREPRTWVLGVPGISHASQCGKLELKVYEHWVYSVCWMLGSGVRLPQTVSTLNRSRAYVYVLRHNTAFRRETIVVVHPASQPILHTEFNDITQRDQNA